MTRWRPKKLRIVLGLLAISALLLVVDAFYFEPHRLIVRHVNLQIQRWPASLDGVKILAVSDTVLGNHDNWYGSPAVTAALTRAGIRVLSNSVVRLDFHDGVFWLAGLQDFASAQPELGHFLNERQVGIDLLDHPAHRRQNR